MALYQLSKQQVEQLLQIINNSNIKGSSAPAIVDLMCSLENPVKDSKSGKNGQ